MIDGLGFKTWAFKTKTKGLSNSGVLQVLEHSSVEQVCASWIAPNFWIGLKDRIHSFWECDIMEDIKLFRFVTSDFLMIEMF